jgi:hypothetical protein
MDTQTNYQIFIPLRKGIYSFRNIMTKTIRAFTQAGSKCSKPTLSSDIRYSVVSKRLVLYQSISSTGKYSRGTKYQLLGDDIPPSSLSVVGIPVCVWIETERNRRLQHTVDIRTYCTMCVMDAPREVAHFTPKDIRNMYTGARIQRNYKRNCSYSTAATFTIQFCGQEVEVVVRVYYVRYIYAIWGRGRIDPIGDHVISFIMNGASEEADQLQCAIKYFFS